MEVSKVVTGVKRSRNAPKAEPDKCKKAAGPREPAPRPPGAVDAVAKSNRVRRNNRRRNVRTSKCTAAGRPPPDLYTAPGRPDRSMLPPREPRLSLPAFHFPLGFPLAAVINLIDGFEAHSALFRWHSRKDWNFFANSTALLDKACFRMSNLVSH
jgi:hypothetical protein